MHFDYYLFHKKLAKRGLCQQPWTPPHLPTPHPQPCCLLQAEHWPTGLILLFLNQATLDTNIHYVQLLLYLRLRHYYNYYTITILHRFPNFNRSERAIKVNILSINRVIFSSGFTSRHYNEQGEEIVTKVCTCYIIIILC